MICKVFIKIFKTTIQKKKNKVLIVPGDMIAEMISNKKLNSNDAGDVQGAKRCTFFYHKKLKKSFNKVQ